MIKLVPVGTERPSGLHRVNLIVPVGTERPSGLRRVNLIKSNQIHYDYFA